VFDDAVFDTASDDGLNQEAVAEPKIQAAPLNEGMVAHNTPNRKQPEKYIPDYYFLRLSKTSMAFAMMSVKLMNKGTHRRADVIGMVMVQMSLKAALKK
jgi:hypothetical protein